MEDFRLALRGLTLRVSSGGVYGFLGPNGAGKSTTIRLMLGLQRPDRGTVSLFEQALTRPLLSRVGSLVEAPSLYTHLTGRENLEVHRRLSGGEKASIEQCLSTVGLARDANRVVSGYSSGMKQRLGIAQALLGNPDLLVLDEPTNGLDPAGIHEIRSLIRELPSRRGVTVFLSSHLLSEVEQVATNFAILASGESKFQGTAEDLRMLSNPAVVLEVDDPHGARALLQSHGFEATAAGSRLNVCSNAESASDINYLLVTNGIRVARLAVERATLEQVFLSLTTAPPVEQEASHVA